MHVLITAGPTYEPLDPVRFLGNRSTGKMGYALAEAFAAEGADVTLISGPSALPDPASLRIRTVRVETAAQMFAAATAVAAAADAQDGRLAHHRIGSHAVTGPPSLPCRCSCSFKTT